MATFPRGLKAVPRLATIPRFPEAMQSWGQSGKGQTRAIQNMGREWQEIYPLMDANLATVRALIAAINRGLRSGEVWDIQHPYWHQRLGAGGVGSGGVLVNGASQTGSNLVVDNASPSVANWLRSGDIISVVGGAVVFDVTGDVTTDGSGNATIPINPPIFSGGSPADDAVVTIDPASIFFKAIMVDVSEFPIQDTTRYIDPGLTITWREQPL